MLQVLRLGLLGFVATAIAAGKATSDNSLDLSESGINTGDSIPIHNKQSYFKNTDAPLPVDPDDCPFTSPYEEASSDYRQVFNFDPVKKYHIDFVEGLPLKDRQELGEYVGGLIRKMAKKEPQFRSNLKEFLKNPESKLVLCNYDNPSIIPTGAHGATSKGNVYIHSQDVLEQTLITTLRHEMIHTADYQRKILNYSQDFLLRYLNENSSAADYYVKKIGSKQLFLNFIMPPILTEKEEVNFLKLTGECIKRAQKISDYAHGKEDKIDSETLGRINNIKEKYTPEHVSLYRRSLFGKNDIYVGQIAHDRFGDFSIKHINEQLGHVTIAHTDPLSNMVSYIDNTVISAINNDYLAPYKEATETKCYKAGSSDCKYEADELRIAYLAELHAHLGESPDFVEFVCPEMKEIDKGFKKTAKKLENSYTEFLASQQESKEGARQLS